MTTQEGNNTVVARHLEALATAAKNYTFAELANISVSSGGVSVADFTGATSIAGGASGLVPAPQAGDESKFLRGDGSWATVQSGGPSSAVSSGNVLDTVPASINGGLWYEVIDGTPMLKLHVGNYDYSFGYDKLAFVGDASNALAAYLPFNASATTDACGNTWTATGSPTISDGKLYLDGTNYLVNSTISSDIGSEPWTIDFWATAQNTNQSCTFFGTYNALYGTSGAGANYWISLAWGNGGISLVMHNDDYSLSAGLAQDTRHHYAVTYDGANLRVFVDGVLRLTREKAVTLGGDFVIGSTGDKNGGFCYKGYLERFRIYNGVALWTSDFTPPTASDY